MLINARDVTHFKSDLCDENAIISFALREYFVDLMPEIIIDVGAGQGDIAGEAFPGKRAILLDPLDYDDRPTSSCHRRITASFFDLKKIDSDIKSLLFCHSLQFLDSDLLKLNAKTLDLAPSVIVTVTNKNIDLLGELIRELRRSGHDFNAEEDLPTFPPKTYQLIKEHHFTATVRAESFDELAKAVAYLLDAPDDPSLVSSCERLLRHELSLPLMTIDQTIRLFRHED